MFDVPHASCNEILHFMEKRVCLVILTNDSFWKIYLISFDYSFRRKVTKDMIEKGEMDPLYYLVCNFVYLINYVDYFFNGWYT